MTQKHHNSNPMKKAMVGEINHDRSAPNSGLINAISSMLIDQTDGLDVLGAISIEITSAQ
jgi:hypothetical protein